MSTGYELFTIATDVPEARSLTNAFHDAVEHDVPTIYGVIRVAVQGNAKKPAIITYHDIGLNYVTCFQGFFHCSDMKILLEHFCVYHVNAPGQNEGAMPLIQSQINQQRDGYSYPSMDQLADTLLAVTSYFNIKMFIGFGVGAGANVICRFALKHPDEIEAMVLINPVAGACGWVEWGYQKWNSWYLKSGELTNFTQDYLLWHWFGRNTVAQNTDLVHVYRQYVKTINPVNLALFIDSYCSRTDLGITRPRSEAEREKTCMIRVPTMIVIGDHGPSLDESVDMNGRMDPTNTTLVKFADCGGMVLEEVPVKLAESFRLFLQGQGYIPLLSQTKLVEARSKHRAIPTDIPSAILNRGDQPVESHQPVQC